MTAAVIAVLGAQAVTGVAYAAPMSTHARAGSTAKAGAAADSSAGPLDVIGAPSASVAVQADNLMIKRTSIDGSVTSDQWGTSAATLKSFTQKGTPGAEQSRTQLRPELASIAARPLDVEHDRTLSLRLDAAGDSGLLQVASADATADPQWADQATHNAEPSAGATFVLSLPADTAGGTLSEPDGSPGFGSQMALDRSFGTAARQQFSMVDAGGGYFELVNLSDGLCLNNANASSALFAPMAEFPCVSGDSASQWKLVQADTSGLGGFRGYAVYNKASKLVLSRDGSNIVQRAYNDVQIDASQVWQLTKVNQRGGVVPTWSMPVSRDPGIAAAMSAGDLDRTVDNDMHQYHDETVVAYVNSAHKVEVRVIDYNANASHLLVTEKTLPDSVGGIVNGEWLPGSVGVAVGNFDSSDLNEIAITWQQQSGAIAASFLTYRSADGTADGDRSLNLVSTGEPIANYYRLQGGTTKAPSLITGMVSTTTGDLDASGTASLALAYGNEYLDSNNTNNTHQAFPTITAAKFTPSLKVQQVKNFDLPTDPREQGAMLIPPTGTTWMAHGPQIAAGLFKIDAAKQYLLHRRELAVAWSGIQSSSPSGVVVRTWLSLFTAATGSLELSTPSGHGPVLESANLDPATQPLLWRSPLSVAAGGFAGAGQDSDAPLWGIAISDGGITNSGSTWTDYLRLFSVVSDDFTQTYVEGETISLGGRRDYELTSYDRDGRTVRLGAPLKLHTAGLQQIASIGEQVPVHADWFGDQFVNVSRTGDEALTLGTTTSSKTSTTTRLHTSTGIGFGQGLDASASLLQGVPKVDGTQTTVKASAKFSESWDQESTSMNQSVTTTDGSESTVATDDDLVTAIYVPYTIYRYPIIGSTVTRADGTPVPTGTCADCTGYYEVIYPGQPTSMHGGGRNFSWYQPDHQNGNVLSYPVTGDGGLVAVPDDEMGSYTYNDGGKTDSDSGFLFNQSNIVGSTSTKAGLDISHTTGTESEHTTTKTLKSSQEVSVGSSFTVGLPGVIQGKFDVNVSATFDQNSVESNTSIGGVENTSTSSFSLDLAEIQNDHSYTIGTGYYVDPAGVSRVAQAVKLISGSSTLTPADEFWKGAYGTKPDLALNLPNAMLTVPNKDELAKLDDVAWSDLPSAQQIRGFYALQPNDPSSPTTSNVPYASNPAAGDDVRFQVQVHNYSLLPMTDDLNDGADFWAVPVDAVGNVEPGKSVHIGSAPIHSIPAQGSETVTSPAWSAVGPTGTDDLQNWRIFVRLDPHGSIDEIHPLSGGAPCPASSVVHSWGRNETTALIDPMTGEPSTLPCGQNNQGFGSLTVMAPSSKLGAKPGTSSHVQLAGGGLLPPDGSGVGHSHGIAKLVVGQQVQIAIHADASASTSDISHVLVTDGPFSKGNLVADTPLAGTDATNGGTATFDYRPMAAGAARPVRASSTVDGTTSTQTLVVNVAAHGAPSTLKLSPAKASVKAGGHQSYTATGYDRYGNRVGDVTSRTRFTTKPAAHCTGHICSASKAGKYTVIGVDGTATGRASLVVQAAPPRTAPIVAPVPQASNDGGGNLPFTGFQATRALAAAAVLIGIGIGLLIVARRRRRVDPASLL